MSNINKEELMRGLSDSQVNKSKQDFGTNALDKKRDRITVVDVHRSI